ncbi:MAG: methyltransferase family protein, partial [Armatimonadota bacterium]
KCKKLTTSGPYAHTRNPLYLGSFVSALGAIIFSGNLWLTAVFLVTFAIFYGSTMRSEANFLSSHYGEEFEEYRKHVPAFFPRLLPYGSDKGEFTWERAVLNKEFKFSATSVLVPALIALIAYLR